MRTYQTLSSLIYDRTRTYNHGFEEELAFYMGHAFAADGAVLEPMCGSGSFLIPMMEKGIKIDGFDYSESMLSILRTKRGDANVWAGSIENPTSYQDKKYATAFIPSGSFGLITDDDSILMALKNIYNSLLPGGIFVFEIETSSSREIEPGKLRVTEYGLGCGNRIIKTCVDMVCEPGVTTVLSVYELIANGAVILTEREKFVFKMHNPYEMQGLISVAGFAAIKMVKAFDSTKNPALFDTTTVFECTK